MLSTLEELAEFDTRLEFMPTPEDATLDHSQAISALRYYLNEIYEVTLEESRSVLDKY